MPETELVFPKPWAVVMPMVHIDGLGCWCEPYLKQIATDKWLVVHREHH